MFSCLLKLTRSRFFTQPLAVVPSDPLKLNLIKIFSEQQSKRQLCRALKILPFYFTVDLIDQFTRTKQYPQYLEYVQQSGESGGDSVYLSSFFSTPWLKKLVTGRLLRRYLEAYMHWLLHACPAFDLYYNDYLLESLNLERPDKWFQIKSYCPQRTFIYHHGPTNSGKSTSAVEQLRNLRHDQNGIYMAPLRLLAWEYQQKLGNCSLVTGQQKEYRNSNLVSCTIEAAPLAQEYEVAVIDQIQMIGISDRGWGWTKAILSLKAKRIHLCGDERALSIITRLVEMTGDVLEERRYSRLSKLILVHKNFRLESISEGDCVINFSVSSLIQHRNDINKMMVAQGEEDRGENVGNGEEIKRNHAAIVYGKLPPECRKDQARRFNDKNLPFLVATNAIGMGLNLNIKRIVFMAIHRTLDGHRVQLQDHEIQQIAGRAGRGKQTGYVQCMNGYILNRVKKALSHVNLSYGLNLQNIAENETDKVEPTQEAVVEGTSEMDGSYNVFLKRHLTAKECQIEKAGYYYSVNYIAKTRIQLQTDLGIVLSYRETMNFLKENCIFGEDYFLQLQDYPDYLIQMLEDKHYDTDDMFIFLNGLSLSLVPGMAKPEMKLMMRFYHGEFINSFIGERRVRVPQVIVECDRDGFRKFVYMDQIVELQYYFNLLESYVWLWGKYEFQFYQITLAREIKVRLAHKISAVLMDNLFLPNRRREGEENSFTRARELVNMVKPKRPRERPTSANEADGNGLQLFKSDGTKVKRSESEKQQMREKYNAIYGKKVGEKGEDGEKTSLKRRAQKELRNPRQKSGQLQAGVQHRAKSNKYK